ncbi:hypothetical protein CSIRO_3342 [Bradyrhizobiaceae bacterium SG-6C]|nr:hypothetical protein CSIRO_3342 [Bradyrhizobiaceae bacterium SG-6C]
METGGAVDDMAALKAVSGGYCNMPHLELDARNSTLLLNS